MAESSQFNRRIARISVGAYDDAQDVRTSLMNRIRDIIRKRREGIPFDQVEEEKEQTDYSSEYNDDNLPNLVEELLEDGKLSDREHRYVSQMLDAAQAASSIEDQYKSVMEISEQEPIFERWLTNVYGVSTTLTARLIHRFGYCEDFEKVSNLWSYSGLAPGQKRRRGEQLDYSPQAKTLAWLVSDNMVKQGSRSEYRKRFYDPYKEKQILRLNRNEEGVCIKCGDNPQAGKITLSQWECGDCNQTGFGDNSAMRHMDAMEKADEPHSVSFGVDNVTKEVDVCASCANHIVEQGEHFPSAPDSRGHADTRARRYLGKKFLKHYWHIAREISDLPTPDEWIVTHGGHEKETETWENPMYAMRALQDPTE